MVSRLPIEKNTLELSLISFGKLYKGSISSCSKGTSFVFRNGCRIENASCTNSVENLYLSANLLAKTSFSVFSSSTNLVVIACNSLYASLSSATSLFGPLNLR